MKHFGQLLVNLFHLLPSYIVKAQVSGLSENLSDDLMLLVCTRCSLWWYFSLSTLKIYYSCDKSSKSSLNSYDLWGASTSSVSCCQKNYIFWSNKMPANSQPILLMHAYHKLTCPKKIEKTSFFIGWDNVA